MSSAEGELIWRFWRVKGEVEEAAKEAWLEALVLVRLTAALLVAAPADVFRVGSEQRQQGLSELGGLPLRGQPCFRRRVSVPR